MKGIRAAAAALSVALVAAGAVPRAAANGDEYQFIISGDPVAAAVAGSSSASSETSALVGGPLADGSVYGGELEARFRTTNDSNLSWLRSDKPKGCIISLF